MLLLIAYAPVGLALLIVRLALLIVLVALRSFLCMSYGVTGEVTVNLTKLYMISCGVFMTSSGDVSGASYFPINRVTSCDEFILAITSRIKSIINPIALKGSFLTRIFNLSVGGAELQGQKRFIFEDTTDFINIPAQQTVQPVTTSTISFAPYSIDKEDGLVLAAVKILSSPIMIFDSRFLKPVKLSDIPEDKTIPDYLQEKMKESRVRPMPDQLFRRTIPRRQAPVTQQPQVTVTPELLQKLNQITEVFPEIDRTATLRDLSKTNSIDLTIQNILNGKIPNAPPKPKVVQKTTPKISEIRTDLVAESLKDGSNPIKPHMDLDDRKEALLQYARAKFLSKLNADSN